MSGNIEVVIKRGRGRPRNPIVEKQKTIYTLEIKDNLGNVLFKKEYDNIFNIHKDGVLGLSKNKCYRIYHKTFNYKTRCDKLTWGNYSIVKSIK